jgi:hypothetical protein
MLVATPAQEAYELLRPIVLFGRTPTERAAVLSVDTLSAATDSTGAF